MKSFFTRHRAALALVGYAALAVDFGWDVPDDAAGLTLIGVGALVLLIVVGGAAIFTSSYWKILYRESPLQRARTGISDLDERELALRDRANGLTYYVFVVATLCTLGVAAVAVEHWGLVLDDRTLVTLIIPYAYFATSLPVVMLEWFEPSGWMPEPVEEEE